MKVRAKASAKERPKAEEKAKLDEHEWNFADACPETELEECKVYEAARRTRFWPLAFWVFSASPRPVWSFSPCDRTWNRIHQFLSAFPEFTEIPWLSIPQEVRSSRLATLADPRAGRPALLELESLNPSFDPAYSNVETQGHGPFWGGGKSEILPKYHIRVDYVCGMEQAFHVAWEYPDADIEEAFSQWLTEHRPPSCGVFNQRGKREDRPDMLRSALQALGAWSLSRLKWSEIKLHTVLRKGDARKTPLYANISSYQKAVRRAEKIIGALEQSHFRFFSMFTDPLPLPNEAVDGYEITREAREIVFKLRTSSSKPKLKKKQSAKPLG